MLREQVFDRNTEWGPPSALKPTTDSIDLFSLLLRKPIFAIFGVQIAFSAGTSLEWNGNSLHLRTGESIEKKAIGVLKIELYLPKRGRQWIALSYERHCQENLLRNVEDSHMS